MLETNQAEIAVLRRLFSKIEDDVSTLLAKSPSFISVPSRYSTISSSEPMYTDPDNVLFIMKQYNEAIIRYNELQKNPLYHLKKIEAPRKIMPRYFGAGTKPHMDANEVKRVMKETEYSCDVAIAYLENLCHSLPQEKRDELHHLKEQFDTFSNEIHFNHAKNCLAAINELEMGHTLSAALIASRGFENAREKCFAKKSEEEIIIELVEKGFVNKDRKDLKNSLIKALRSARNFSSHDVSIYPEYSDASSLVTDYVSFLNTVKSILKRQ